MFTCSNGVPTIPWSEPLVARLRIQVPTTRRVVQIASLAAGDSWERIKFPAGGAHCAYAGWGWRADGGG